MFSGVEKDLIGKLMRLQEHPYHSAGIENNKLTDEVHGRAY